MKRLLVLSLTTVALSGCISRNQDPGLAGNGLLRVTCPLSDSDAQCGARALKLCRAKGRADTAGLTFGQETKYIQANCTVIGGARICSPKTTTVRTATFICAN